MNLDRPFRLLTLEKNKMWQTPDEAWVIVRVGDLPSFRVGRMDGTVEPQTAVSLWHAICLIKTALTGYTWYRHATT